MQLSVIVPVYNMAAEGKLNFCMDSLVSQTVEDMEIIAVDDASTDASLEILRTYEAAHPGRVRVITYPVNRRQGGAKNEGCDYSLVAEHTFTVGKVVRNNTREQTGELDGEKHRKLLLRSGSMVIKIYKADVIRENDLHFPEGIFYEDNCAGPLWSLYFKRFERVEEPLYFYYQHEHSTVHYITEEKCRDRMRAAALLYDECKKRGFLERFHEELEYRFTELYYVVTLFSYMQGVKRPKLSFIRELREGAEERFPEFRKNKYYRQYTGPEEQRLIEMQAASDLRFFWYYRLKTVARKLLARARRSAEHG